MTSTEAAFRGLDLRLSRLRPWRHGLMLFLAADKIIGRALELYGEFAETENRVMVRLVGAGDLVLDVGANVGTVTLPLAAHVGPSGRVIAFEPQRLVFQHLCANIALNGLTNVDARWAAVGATAGSARIPALDPTLAENFGATRLAADGEVVAVTPIDSLQLERCDLIKIDVEGMEDDVLRGAEHTIAKHRPALYFEAKKSDNTRWCLSWLLQRDYRLYWHFAPFFSRPNHRGLDHNVFGDYGDINALALPGESNRHLHMPPVTAADADWQVAYHRWGDEQKR